MRLATRAMSTYASPTTVVAVADHGYTYRLTEAELDRYRAMAAQALEHEAELWAAAGIVTSAAVVDLGCGPGVFLPELAARTGPGGIVAGVDAAPPARPPPKSS